MTLAVSLDLGTTSIKAAHLERDGALGQIIRVSAPPVVGEELLRESDPLDYLERTRELLNRSLESASPDTPIGVASQRSTFVLWEKSSGRPVTPLISWQDRRAAAWCRSRQKAAAFVTARTGLPLSPHYAGPKFSQLLSGDRVLREKAGKGHILFGTLESWILWSLASGKDHVTDISMAARTLLADPVSGSWSEELLEFFDIPSACLPTITRAGRQRIVLAAGGVVTATVADQPAALFAIAGANLGNALINLGTGGFILFPSKDRTVALPGYLAGPAGGREEGLLAFEGTINGVGPALAESGESVPFPSEDTTADLFCLPETSGLGSPFWRPDIPQLFSRPPEAIGTEDRARVVREGVIFRIRQVVEDIEAALGRRSLFLAGGIAGDRFFVAGLTACLGRALYRPAERESTLLGAAFLARGFPGGNVDSEVFPPHPTWGGYLRSKYHRWLEWALRLPDKGKSPKEDGKTAASGMFRAGRTGSER